MDFSYLFFDSPCCFLLCYVFSSVFFPFQDDKQSSDESTTELGLANVGGVFVVLTAGIVMAFFISIGEFLWNVRKIAVKEHVSILRDYFFFLSHYFDTSYVEREKEKGIKFNRKKLWWSNETRENRIKFTGNCWVKKARTIVFIKIIKIENKLVNNFHNKWIF